MPSQERLFRQHPHKFVNDTIDALLEMVKCESKAPNAYRRYLRYLKIDEQKLGEAIQRVKTRNTIPQIS